MIPRKNRGCAANLLITLPDQLLKNFRATLEARLNLGQCMLAIGASDDEISCALQQR